MTCHNCPHDREIARLRETCTKCQLGEKCAVSGTFSLDAMTDGAIETGELRAKVAAGASVVTTFNPDTLDAPADDAAGRVMPSMPESAEEYVLELLRRFSSLTLTDVLVVHGLLNGWGIVRMADMYGESKQAIWARVRNAIGRHPWIAELDKWNKYRMWRNGADVAADRAGGSEDKTGAAWVKRYNLHMQAVYLHAPTVAEADGAGNGTRAGHPRPSRPPRLAVPAGKAPAPRLEADRKPRKPPAW